MTPDQAANDQAEDVDERLYDTVRMLLNLAREVMPRGYEAVIAVAQPAAADGGGREMQVAGGSTSSDSAQVLAMLDALAQEYYGEDARTVAAWIQTQGGGAAQRANEGQLHMLTDVLARHGRLITLELVRKHLTAVTTPAEVLSTLALHMCQQPGKAATALLKAFLGMARKAGVQVAFARTLDGARAGEDLP